MSVRAEWQQVKSLPGALFREMRDTIFGRIVPLRPRTLNLLINDVCNSRCRMCNIWRMKKDFEILPAELARILADPLFSRLEYVGVSGGEPTLRQDLPDLFNSVASALPRLRGAGIITNAINGSMAIERIAASADICRRAGIPFHVMVSLDGIGPVHDRIRGRKGNFDSAMTVIRHFIEKADIPVTVGCTIIRENAWHVDEMLDFCMNEKIPVHFRVGEFIRRLYNADLTASIRNFDDRQTYHLGLFFARLEYAYERRASGRLTYRNIRRMLIGSGRRSTGCIFQSRAVTLDCRGQLLYCAPRSPVLGNCLSIPANRLYRQNVRDRRTILETGCPNCIHDYPTLPAPTETWREYRDRFHRWRISLDRVLRITDDYGKYSAHDRSDPGNRKRFLIIGWFGTETAGDKAILGEIVFQLKKQWRQPRIVLASLYPDYSRQTMKELGCGDIPVIPVDDSQFFREIETSEEVIMGGGPLMHLDRLGMVLAAFYRARRKGRRTRIMGCGIGPLDRGMKYVEAVKRILHLANVIEVRDSASAAWAKNLTGRNDIAVSGDYATGYVDRWLKRGKSFKKQPFLNLYLRDWTTEYQADLTHREFQARKELFETELEKWVREICMHLNIRPRLLPMHHFVVGGDDRIFNRRFARRHLQELDPIIEMEPLALNEILQSMAEATFAVCMRFHSVLFAACLKIPFFAIDYTNGGKIRHYLADHNLEDRMIGLHSITEGHWREMTPRLSTVLETN